MSIGMSTISGRKKKEMRAIIAKADPIVCIDDGAMVLLWSIRKGLE